MPRRPKAIPIVSGFLFLATVAAAIVGVSLLFPNPLLDCMWELNQPAAAAFRSMGRTAGVLLLLLGTVTLASAIGLLRRKRWAWWIAVALFAMNVAGDAVSLIVLKDRLRGASGLAVAGSLLWTLLRPTVKNYFRIAAMNH
jgi:formate-dependent nitrite reductase membrane component NrfD